MYSTLSSLSLLSRFVTFANLHSRSSYLKLQSEAISWYVRSAEQGYGLASNNLGGIFMAGDDGVAPDRELAKKWYRQAKEQGFLHVPSNDYLESRS